MPGDSRETKGLYAFFAEHPHEARLQFFDPAKGVSRRGFFAGAGLVASGGLLGMAVPFYANMPHGLVPAAFASEDVLVGKDGLTLLNDLRSMQRRQRICSTMRSRPPPGTSSAITDCHPRMSMPRTGPSPSMGWWRTRWNCPSRTCRRSSKL